MTNRFSDPLDAVNLEAAVARFVVRARRDRNDAGEVAAARDPVDEVLGDARRRRVLLDVDERRLSAVTCTASVTPARASEKSIFSACPSRSSTSVSFFDEKPARLAVTS